MDINKAHVGMVVGFLMLSGGLNAADGGVPEGFFIAFIGLVALVGCGMLLFARGYASAGEEAA